MLSPLLNPVTVHASTVTVHANTVTVTSPQHLTTATPSLAPVALEASSLVDRIRHSFEATDDPEGLYTALDTYYRVEAGSSALRFQPRTLTDDGQARLETSGFQLHWQLLHTDTSAWPLNTPTRTHVHENRVTYQLAEGVKTEQLLLSGSVRQTLELSQRVLEPLWEGDDALTLRLELPGVAWAEETPEGIWLQDDEGGVALLHAPLVMVAGTVEPLPFHLSWDGEPLAVEFTLPAWAVEPDAERIRLISELQLDVERTAPTATTIVLNTAPVSTALSLQIGPDVVWNGSTYLVVWADNRTDGINYDIYAARVTNKGAVTDINGVVVSAATGHQLQPKVSWSGSNFLVVWHDYRNGSEADIYGARLSSAAGLSDTAGLKISGATGNQLVPDVGWSGTSFFVVWQDARNGGQDIYGARVTTSGTISDANGVVVSNATGEQRSPAIAWNTVNFVVTWSDLRSGTADIYAARVSSAAALLDANGILISSAAGVQQDPAITADTNKNVLIVWSDGRSGTGFDIYGARLSTTPAVLDANGLAFSTAANDQSLPAVTYNATGYVVIWGDKRFTGTYWDIYGTRMTLAGAILDPAGFPVFTGAYNNATLYSLGLAADTSYFMAVWSDNRSGSYDVQGAILAADDDEDGVANASDNCAALYNPSQVDADRDGKGDACDTCPKDASNDADADSVCGDIDNCPTVSNSSQLDSDADLKGDACDNCIYVSNSTQTDTDVDKIGDACDACPKDANNDVDKDTICGDVDNCPSVANTTQTNTDADSLGDACDACPQDKNNDADLDGVCGNVDNCPSISNGSQLNQDGDTLGDVCDACPKDALNDSDKDTICGDVDNCPTTANTTQTDTDKDARGDACDTCPKDAANDSDGDTLCADVDNCPTISNVSQADADKDNLGDACDACALDADNDVDKDTICGNLDNCPSVANTNQRDTDQDGLGDACDACPSDPLNDVDKDNICGDVDNCPSTANTSQTDVDGDKQGDACDPCPKDSLNDVDKDTICGNLDNCPSVSNSGQQDQDGDTVGDACDVCPKASANDIDKDGVCEDVDNCPSTANTSQLDTDGDKQGDACDVCPKDALNDLDKDGACGDVDNCPSASNANQADQDGDGLGDTCDG
ncbi:MAG: thrombospondin type 3 repeat-containing protein, partial [Myxococcota bacterium]